MLKSLPGTLIILADILIALTGISIYSADIALAGHLLSCKGRIIRLLPT